MDLALVVGNIALICTIASNFAGLPACLEFYKMRTTLNASILPFLSAAACSSLWLQYGIFVGDQVLEVVNLISVFLQMLYVICFYLHTAEKKKTELLMFAVLIFILSIYAYTFHFAGNKATALNTLGVFACIGSILTSAAPLVNLKEVFQTKSTDSLPFLIIFATFIVNALWYIYGHLINDTFIQIPNFIGASLSGFQLSLFAKFSSKPAS